MNLKNFRAKMKKSVFSTVEAHIVAFRTNPKLVNLQLYQWARSKDLIALKRGVYMFADAKPTIAEIANALYYPCYFSLEYILNLNGIIPEAVFSYTFVTPKATRTFKTPLGTFIYQKIKKEAFTGFDPKTLIAKREKALTDYFYLKSSKLIPSDDFWEESRLNGAKLDFKKVHRFAKLYRSKKLIALLNSFQRYAKTH